MANNIAVGDRVMCRIWSRDEEQAAVNTFWLACTATTGASIGDDELAGFLSDDYAGDYKALLSFKATYLGTVVQIWRYAVGWLNDQSSTAGTGIGTYSSEALPRQVTGLLSLKTDFGGQKNRGRLYIPFVSKAAATEEGEPTADYLTALENFRTHLALYIGGDTIVGIAGSATMQLGIYHRRKPPLEPPVDMTAVQRIIVKTAFATQRRRGTLGKANKSPF